MPKEMKKQKVTFELSYDGETMKTKIVFTPALSGEKEFKKLLSTEKTLQNVASDMASGAISALKKKQ